MLSLYHLVKKKTTTTCASNPAVEQPATIAEDIHLVASPPLAAKKTKLGIHPSFLSDRNSTPSAYETMVQKCNANTKQTEVRVPALEEAVATIRT